MLLSVLGGCMNQENKINAINDPFKSDQEVIKKLLIDIFATAKAKDMDRLEAYHLNSPKFSKFDDGDVPDIQDYAMAKKTEEELFTSISEFDYTLPDVKVDVFDDVAIASFILDYSVVMGEDTFAAKSRSTLVFVKVDGQWKIAHEHFSPYSQGS
jgi:ketosteroid isomerase-like protein